MNNATVEAVEYHNLVEVDGHPIHIRGSVSNCLPVIITETKFQQKFGIADGIITEGILGMDFMEVNKRVVGTSGKRISLKD